MYNSITHHLYVKSSSITIHLLPSDLFLFTQSSTHGMHRNFKLDFNCKILYRYFEGAYLMLLRTHTKILYAYPSVWENAKWRKNCELEADFAWDRLSARAHEAASCVHLLQHRAERQKRGGEDGGVRGGLCGFILLGMFFFWTVDWQCGERSCP